MTLLHEVADFENLLLALKRCAKGKRNSAGYLKMLFATGEQLADIRRDLLSGTFKWGPYRQFEIRDPKRRRISAAPFSDRIVHTAICLVIEPALDRLMSENVYACRLGKGNRNAVIDLVEILRKLGPARFVIKLDIEKYFESIRHQTLFESVSRVLKDSSLDTLLKDLLSSHPEYGPRGRGLPIGNLTSQLFANYYLHSADELILKKLNGGFYLRYMDDFVIGGPDKSQVLDAAAEVVTYLRKVLGLRVPIQKHVPLGSSPVPFLGFVVDHLGYRVLTRNKRRHRKSLRRLEEQGAAESRMEMTRQSWTAWADLDLHFQREAK